MPSPTSEQIEDALLRAGRQVLSHGVTSWSEAGVRTPDEMAAYQSLIIPVTALGASDALKLLEENREQEVHTSEELATRLKELVS